jgi:hypothetical protein
MSITEILILSGVTVAVAFVWIALMRISVRGGG